MKVFLLLFLFFGTTAFAAPLPALASKPVDTPKAVLKPKDMTDIVNNLSDDFSLFPSEVTALPIYYKVNYILQNLEVVKKLAKATNPSPWFDLFTALNNALQLIHTYQSHLPNEWFNQLPAMELRRTLEVDHKLYPSSDNIERLKKAVPPYQPLPPPAQTQQ